MSSEYEHDTLVTMASEISAGLDRTGLQLVLAESCTAGLVAASLGAVPGISRHFCGSSVVYQERTKSAWLGVPSVLLSEKGAVSSEVASAMTTGALRQTWHADLAASITGHLGPDAPAELDGLVFIAIQRREELAAVSEHRLERFAASDRQTARRKRQMEAARLMLDAILAELG